MAEKLIPEQLAPEFSLLDQNGNTQKLTDYRGKWVVLYAYPRDLTPGCTLQAEEFTALLPEFKKISAVVLGISPDSVAKHQSFCEKKSLEHILLADEDHQTIEAYGAWKLKKFMGREFMGVVRSTWLIDPQGKINAAWYNVKAKGHAQKVLEDLQSKL